MGPFIRKLTAAAVLLFATSAGAAEPGLCPNASSGWSKQWVSGTLQFATYERWSQVLYVVFFDQTVQAFYGVPSSATRTFDAARNPYQFYSASILPRYPMILLQEMNNCPVLQEETGTYVLLN